MNRNDAIELRENAVFLCFKPPCFVHPVQRSVIFISLGKPRQTSHSMRRTILLNLLLPGAAHYPVLQ